MSLFKWKCCLQEPSPSALCGGNDNTKQSGISAEENKESMSSGTFREKGLRMDSCDWFPVINEIVVTRVSDTKRAAVGIRNSPSIRACMEVMTVRHQSGM